MEAAIFLATGFEEMEAVATADVLRRAGVKIDMVSITEDVCVEGAHGISVWVDLVFEEFSPERYDILILPGGMPGTSNLDASPAIKDILRTHSEQGKPLAAICAAPSVLGGMGLLEGRKATCYPGYEDKLKGATVTTDAVVVDGNIITGRGPGKAVDFGLAIVERFFGKDKAKEVAEGLLYKA
jgi:4-methyl-5(b-hydroxyethyl)-thiazole monophosphate biosynthesis